MSEPHRLGAREARARIEAGMPSPAALLASCLERIADLEPEVGAFAHLDPAAALARDRRAIMRGADAPECAMEAGGLDIPVAPPSAPDDAPEGLVSTGDRVFNRIWTALGLPAISLPQTSGPKGLPIGLQIVGRRGADARTIAAVLFLERLLAKEGAAWPAEAGRG